MTEQLSKFNKKFVYFNQILSVIAMVASIIPSFVFYLLYLYSKSYGIGNPYVISIPVAFYVFWVCVLGAGINALKISKVGVKTSVLFNVNCLISTPLLLGYAYIIFEILIH